MLVTAEIKQSLDHKFEVVLTNLRIERIYNTMVALDWCWAMDDGQIKVPTVGAMHIMLRRLYDSTFELACRPESNGIGRVSSGGFSVEIDLKQQTVEVLFEVDRVCSSDYV